VARAEVFIETKIWISDYGYDETLNGSLLRPAGSDTHP
jgi:diketogulonate reductase-like aldo/keto reductase